MTGRQPDVRSKHIELKRSQRRQLTSVRTNRAWRSSA
jgi:plasmid maintenance system killer protein